MYLIILFIILIILFYLANNKKEEINLENFTIQKLDKKYKIRREDCLDYCDEKSCLKMFDKQKQLLDCERCSLKGGCFQKGIVTNSCNVCQEGEEPTNCRLTSNYGCKDNNNLMSFNGVNPYYILAGSDGYTYTKECKFCWNL